MRRSFQVEISFAILERTLPFVCHFLVTRKPAFRAHVQLNQQSQNNLLGPWQELSGALPNSHQSQMGLLFGQ